MALKRISDYDLGATPVLGTTMFEIETAAGASNHATMAMLRLQPVTVLSIAAGVVNIDCALGRFFTLILTSNVTSITFTNLPAAGSGLSLSVRVRQDATGSRTMALPASFKATGGSDTAVQSAANAYTLLELETFDQGTRWEYAMQEIAA